MYLITKYGDHSTEHESIISAGRALIELQGNPEIWLKDVSALAGMTEHAVKSFYTTPQTLVRAIFMDGLFQRLEITRTALTDCDHVDELIQQVRCSTTRKLETACSDTAMQILWRHHLKHDSYVSAKQNCLKLESHSLAAAVNRFSTRKPYDEIFNAMRLATFTLCHLSYSSISLLESNRSTIIDECRQLMELSCRQFL